MKVESYTNFSSCDIIPILGINIKKWKVSVVLIWLSFGVMIEMGEKEQEQDNE